MVSGHVNAYIARQVYAWQKFSIVAGATSLLKERKGEKVPICLCINERVNPAAFLSTNRNDACI